MQESANSSINNSSFGLQAGLFSSIPVVIWCLLQTRIYLEYSPWAPTLAEAVKALWILQAIAIALVLPWYVWRCHWTNSLLQSATLISIPLPVYTISILSSALSSNALLLALGFLILLTIGLIFVIKLTDRFAGGTQAKTLARATIQLGSAILIWTYRDLWLAVILK